MPSWFRKHFSCFRRELSDIAINSNRTLVKSRNFNNKNKPKSCDKIKDKIKQNAFIEYSKNCDNQLFRRNSIKNEKGTSKKGNDEMKIKWN